MSAIAVNNKIYWAGGGNNSFGPYPPSQQVEIRDVATQTSTIDCLFEPKLWTSNAAVQKDNKIIFYWGAKFDIYDLTTNSWSIGVNPEGGSTIISLNNILYLIGGYNVTNGLPMVSKLEF